MSLYEISQSFWPHLSNSNPFPLTEEFPETSSSMQYLETIFSDDCMEFPDLVDDFQVDFDQVDHIFKSQANDMLKISDRTLERGENYRPHEWNSVCSMNAYETAMDFDEFDQIFSDNMLKFIDQTWESEENSPSNSWNLDQAMDVHETSIFSSLALPFEGMEIDNQNSLLHLFVAYSEAMENQETELSRVIAQRIVKKVNPIGGTVERLLYYMFQHLINQPNYLTQESIKNFYPAFKAIYQMFPYGRLIHHLANLATLEVLSSDVDILHVIDFDIGEGIQWASLMDTIKDQCREIRVTSVNLNEDEEISPSRWKFEDTKRRLLDHGTAYGLKLEVDEVGLQDLERVLKNMNTGRKSFYVFNCHVGLLHMGRIRSKNDVFEFLNVASNFLHHVRCSSTSEGIITYGDGDALHDSKTCSYSLFLERNLDHYRAILESMESNFPSHLGEARIALEYLFLAPYVSSIKWDRKCEEIKQYIDVRLELGLNEWKFNEASLVEAKEMVKEGGSLYGVRVESEKNNEIVMEWNGIPMVRFKCWRS